MAESQTSGLNGAQIIPGRLIGYFSARAKADPLHMDVGETVVLLEDVDGMPAGKEGRVIKVRDDMLLIGFLSSDCLEFVLAKSWEVLPARTVKIASCLARGKTD
jgi:hypothetical protein